MSGTSPTSLAQAIWRPPRPRRSVDVETVLDCLRTGRSIADILKSYPAVSRAAVQEALQLAARALTDYYARQAA